MSVTAMAWVWKHSTARPTDRFVLLAIADVASDEGEVSAYKRSMSALADKTGFTLRSIRTSVHRLVELGELEVTKVGDGRKSSDYRVVMASIEGGTTFLPGRNHVHPREEPRSTQGGTTFTPIIPSLSVLPPSSPVVRSARSEAFGVFWSAYPARDGKKNGKGKAELYWNKLTTDESAQAVIGAKNLTAALAAGGKFGPPDAWRWLRDRSWNDWQTPPARATRPVSYDAPKVIYR